MFGRAVRSPHLTGKGNRYRVRRPENTENILGVTNNESVHGSIDVFDQRLDSFQIIII